ncbi:hypothetical protein Rt10032_c17g5894 [Rhodotorula toruloides]|uniref:Uncharacterized protein n=1 Tax=Rhodotorula toruloides TaxID=5286 RepID=A0A511KNF3_RHOTO|nr:hypothetical protein Rt10032_c17g5894 [Rhodotorula toruloides]
MLKSDGTLVGYLDAIHDIVLENVEYLNVVKLKKEVRTVWVNTVWVNEEKVICPFWGRITEAERRMVLEALDHVVSALEHFNDQLPAGHGHELLHTALGTLLNLLKDGLEFKKRTTRPQVFDPYHGGPQRDVSHYASLAHPLVTPRRLDEVESKRA